MRKIYFIITAILFITSCGDPNMVNQKQDSALLAAAGNSDNILESSGSSCNEVFNTPLTQAEIHSYSPKLRFIASARNSANNTKLNNKSTTKQRCFELKNQLSGSTLQDELSLEIDFELTNAQETQLLLGKTVKVHPDTAQLQLTDGSLNATSTDLELHCPGLASVSCQITQIEDYKKCESYQVKFTDECTFRSKLLLFSFSDHKSGQMDVVGELKVSEQNGAQLKFSKISWMGLD